MSIAAAAVESRVLGISVTFRSVDDGKPVTADLGDVWCEPFELVPPVRRPVSHKGQRNFAGSWWCAMTASHVAFESWLERDHPTWRGSVTPSFGLVGAYSPAGGQGRRSGGAGVRPIAPAQGLCSDTPVG